MKKYKKKYKKLKMLLALFEQNKCFEDAPRYKNQFF